MMANKIIEILMTMAFAVSVLMVFEAIRFFF